MRTEEFAQKPAGLIKPGDRTQFGTGYDENWRTVSRVERRTGGIVRIYHRETRSDFYEEYGEQYLVNVVPSRESAES